MTRTSRTRRSATAFLLVLTLAVTVAGCGSDASSTADTVAERDTSTALPTSSTSTSSPTDGVGAETDRPAGVTTRSIVLVDEARTTDAGAATEAQPTRTLDTDLYVPAGRGPFPLIVFGHGLAGHPDDFTRLLTAWADAGYLVAAPAFPLTNTSVPESGANVPDVVNQPGDVSFVVDEMLRLSAEDDDELSGLVDPDHIGIAGLSLGGVTTYATAFSDCCRDDRIDAAVVLAGVAGTLGDFGAFEPSGDLPVLVMHGDADGVIGYQAAVESYALLAPPKYFVTLLGGGHAEPFADQAVEYAPIVDQVTVDFWESYLSGDRTAVDALKQDAVADGLTSFEFDD